MEFDSQDWFNRQGHEAWAAQKAERQRRLRVQEDEENRAEDLLALSIRLRMDSEAWVRPWSSPIHLHRFGSRITPEFRQHEGCAGVYIISAPSPEMHQIGFGHYTLPKYIGEAGDLSARLKDHACAKSATDPPVDAVIRQNLSYRAGQELRRFHAMSAAAQRMAHRRWMLAYGYRVQVTYTMDKASAQQVEMGLIRHYREHGWELINVKNYTSTVPFPSPLDMPKRKKEIA